MLFFRDMLFKNKAAPFYEGTAIYTFYIITVPLSFIANDNNADNGYRYNIICFHIDIANLKYFSNKTSFIPVFFLNKI